MHFRKNAVLIEMVAAACGTRRYSGVTGVVDFMFRYLLLKCENDVLSRRHIVQAGVKVPAVFQDAA